MTARPVTAFASLWNRVWFAPVDGLALSVVRTMYGVVVLGWALTLIPDLDIILVDPSPRGPLAVKPTRIFAITRWTSSPVVIGILFGVVVVAAMLLIVGRRTRPATIALAIAFPSVVQALRPFTNGQDSVLIAWTILLLVTALAAPQSLEGSVLRRYRQPVAVPVWPLRLFQIQVAAGYLIAVTDKLHGASWRNGYAVYYALNNLTLVRDTVPTWFIESRSLVAAATWGTLALELVLPFLLWWPRTRILGFVLAIAMHHAFGYFIELGFFGWAMTIGLLAFITADDHRRLVAIVARWFPGRTRTTSGLTTSETP